jgi:NAD(P)-dependent dehydrogenase (short-subunit alcohol dehydrogenase family)
MLRGRPPASTQSGTMKLFDLTGKVAVVTGSTRGIGKAIARRMAEHGARVVVSSRKAQACEEVTAEINAEFSDGGDRVAMSFPCNISSKQELQGLVDGTIAAWGKIDILVCNAAVNPFFGPSLEIPDDAFDKILACNVRSNHWLCNMVLPQMRERRDGVIIVVSSIGGLMGSPVLGAYGISKAADFQLVRNLAVEHGGCNIRANAIAPGLIKTDFSRALWQNEKILEDTVSVAPLHRIGDPDEIAGAAVFLASSAGAFMTGQSLVIDGGQTIA